MGDRLAGEIGDDAMTAALAITLLSPMPPLLFMGEEWGSQRPFPFFCDFKGALADAVRKGRREEFKRLSNGAADCMPDPLRIETFCSAVLDWDARAMDEGRRRLALVRNLLTTRAGMAHELAHAKFGAAHCEKPVLIVSWSLPAGKSLDLVANLSHEAAAFPRAFSRGRPLWGGAASEQLQPWAVFWSIGDG
jgi:maltooligosyltrehalose trehalohydrolase